MATIPSAISEEGNNSINGDTTMTTLTTTTIETKTRINWKTTDETLIVTFPDTTSVSYDFTKIKDYVQITNPIQHELFVYGLKKKVVDTIAGATKNGISYADQKKTMNEKFEEIRTGVVKTRSNAKVDPFAEVRGKLNAMPDGAEKVAAMALATMLGIIK